MDAYYGIHTFPDTVNSVNNHWIGIYQRTEAAQMIVASQVSPDQRRPQELNGFDAATPKGLREQQIPLSAKQVLTFHPCFAECIPQ